MKEEKDLLCCPHCGSTDVEVHAWVNANTNEYKSECDDHEAWCPNCSHITGLITVEEFREL